jgi:hypothetical protein
MSGYVVITIVIGVISFVSVVVVGVFVLQYERMFVEVLIVQ